MALSFKFSNSNTNSWFLNNLGRLLVDTLSNNVQGVEVYQNTGESLIEVYKDLWGSEEARDNRQDFGIANENVRKLVPKIEMRVPKKVLRGQVRMRHRLPNR